MQVDSITIHKSDALKLNDVIFGLQKRVRLIFEKYYHDEVSALTSIRNIQVSGVLKIFVSVYS